MTSEPFAASFDGSPAAPQPAGSVLTNFDIQVHSRDTNTWYELQPMNALHGSDCSAPPATHLVSAYADAVFQCKNHVMTSINAEGYGVIYLTPDRLLDFSNGQTAKVSFDISTLRTSGRDWWDVWLTPFEGNMPLPLQSWLPDLNGEPRDALTVRMNGGTVCPTLFRNYVEDPLVPGYGNGCTWWTSYDSILTQSATTRTTFEVALSQSHLKVWIPPQASTNGQSLVFFDGDIPGGLPFSQAVVQFGHHSYNPEKDCNQPGPDGVCKANTWHWDNINLSPSIPFAMSKANRRYADAANPTITFAAPAPQNAYLRFSGHESAVEASFNGGPFQRLVEIPTAKGNGGEFGQFFAPVPAGTQSVTFRATPGWSGKWFLQDFSIWSREGATGTAPGSTSTPAPTQPPATATNTPMLPQQPTATPTTPQQPTATPTTPPTSTPTSAPMRTPTPASAPATFSIQVTPSRLSSLEGQAVKLATKVTVSTRSSFLVDVEVVAPSGQRVFQKFYDRQSLGAGTSKTYTPSWVVPRGAEKGLYRVKVGVFKPGWGGLLHWEDSAATFTVR